MYQSVKTARSDSENTNLKDHQNTNQNTNHNELSDSKPDTKSDSMSDRSDNRSDNMSDTMKTAGILNVLQQSRFFESSVSSVSDVSSESSEMSFDEMRKLKGKLIRYFLPEFPVYTGETRHAQRIDLLVIENITTDGHLKPYDVRIHGIEIKVSYHDLINDKKMANYVPFCDLNWLAIPDPNSYEKRSKERIDANKIFAEILADENKETYKHFGLLLVNLKTEKVTVEKFPDSQAKPQATLRELTLSQAVIKI